MLRRLCDGCRDVRATQDVLAQGRTRARRRRPAPAARARLRARPRFATHGARDGFRAQGSDRPLLGRGLPADQARPPRLALRPGLRARPLRKNTSMAFRTWLCLAGLAAAFSSLAQPPAPAP